MAQCKDAVRKGDLRRLLESMPNLETLNIIFHYVEEESDVYPASLCDLVSETVHWKHLTSIEFEFIEASRRDLVDSIRLHSSTPRSIGLKDLRLVRSSQHVFLPQLRELAENMFLDDISREGKGEEGQ